VDGAEALAELRAAGRAVRVGRAMYAHPDAIEAVIRRVRAIVAAEGGVTLARLRDELGTSRRYAQALLEHLDAERVTRRLPDDTRVLRRDRGR
jgi:selenocysteine-specific elongation factor